MTGSHKAVRVRHLRHCFGSIEVVSDVSFEVDPGEIFAFIGPNGAGKTTTLRILATLLEPTAGRVEIEGLDVTVDPLGVRRRIGYMPDHAGVYERVTVQEYLEFFAAACGAPGGATATVLERTGIGALRDQLVVTLSKGMRQRLQLARVLLHDPNVLIMDEPASDLDPRARLELRQLLLGLKDLGKTIILSSHILAELADICTSVGIIERGRLLAAGPVGQIADELARVAAPGAAPAEARPPAAVQRRVRVRLLGDAHQAVPLVAGGPGVGGVEAAPGGWLTVLYSGDDRFISGLVHHLVSHGVPITAVVPEQSELERVFLEVTGSDPR